VVETEGRLPWRPADEVADDGIASASKR
jgi:hypothetical protein